MTTLNGPCPKCGKELQIPDDLTEFSCLYCGARLSRDQLLADGTDTLLRQLTETLGASVTEQANTISYLAPGKYQARYETYLKEQEQVLESLNRLPTAHHKALAESLLDHIDRWAGAGRRADGLLEDAKYTLCLLFVPAVRQLAPWQGKAFCQTLLELWLERHPKQTFQLTTYEDIAGGFDRKKLCFITTAVCTYQGKPDDCRELTAFRAFRDGWLSRQPDGKALIQAYYNIAPSIVTAINVTDPDHAYPAIWKEHLLPCLRMIEIQDLHGCKAHYVRMVETLSRTYLHR